MEHKVNRKDKQTLSEGRAANRRQYCVLDDGTKVDMWEFYRDYQ
ncbi:DUF333 domain-containing protein [Pseudoalteromonas qingdaonensis]